MPAKKNVLSASLEDYVEVIFNLAEADEVVRSKDIAGALGVARPSVTSALKLLAEKGLVNYKRYGYITLTDTGRRTAADIARKHDIINTFLVEVLCVEPTTAQVAACKAEHALGGTVISKLLRFVEFVNAKSSKGSDLTGEFKRFCRDRGRICFEEGS